MELPDDLWNIVKEYQLDYKRIHKRNINPSLEQINGLYKEVYLYSSVFPSLGYGQEVVAGENNGLWVPLQNLPVNISRMEFERKTKMVVWFWLDAKKELKGFKQFRISY